MSRFALLTTVSAFAVLAGLQSTIAADALKPLTFASNAAVSAANGKLGAFGGSIDGVGGAGLFGAYTVPLDRQWGAQVDGLAGTAGGDSFWGAAGHLFWRDPSQGLIGLYGSWVSWSGVGANVGKIGVEGQWYNGPWSVEGNIVEQSGTFNGLAGEATVAFYPQPNFRLEGGYRFLQGIGNTGNVGAEWQANNSGMALFANGSFGESGYSTVIGGLKFYTGAPKTLIDRNRRDDPGVTLPFDLFQGQACPSNRLIDGICLGTTD
jgi:hypothetical protein